MAKHILRVAHVCDVLGAMANLILDVITLGHLVPATRSVKLDLCREN